MNRTTALTTVTVVGIACFGILVSQASRNRSLEKKIAGERQEIASLRIELQRGAPLTSLKDAKRPSSTPRRSNTEEMMAASRAAVPPAERVSRARNQIEQLVPEQLDLSPAAFLKVLPDILRIVQNLSIGEIIAVAEGIDTPASSDNSNGIWIPRNFLLFLAAEEDPLRVMQSEEIMKDYDLRQGLLALLVKHDHQAALEWLKNSDLSVQEKVKFKVKATFQVLRSDVTSGLNLLRELEADPVGRSKFDHRSMMKVPLPAAILPDLVQAYEDPSNQDLREDLAGMLLRTTSTHGGVDALRKLVARVDLQPDEISNFLKEDFYQIIQTQPRAAIDWIIETQDEDAQRQSIPDAIASWANLDFNAAGEYLGTMEASGTKDLSIQQFAQSVSQVDPEAAAEWSLQIGDEQLRVQSIQFATFHWRSKDQDAVQHWLKENRLNHTGRPLKAPVD